MQLFASILRLIVPGSPFRRPHEICALPSSPICINPRERFSTQATSLRGKSHSAASTFALTPSSALLNATSRDMPAVAMFRDAFADS